VLLVLLGMNAHINDDLPQALQAVISDARGRRRSAGGRGAAGRSGPGRRSPTLFDRAMAPLNRAATRRFLTEARGKVWRSAEALQAARVRGPDAYRRILAELEILNAARIHDLLAPGFVVVRLAAGGFGVVIPPR
jgi:hypothetical protein